MNNKTTASQDVGQLFEKVLGFLQLFMCKTLAVRIISMVLISAGASNTQVTELTGLCDKSVRTLRKALVSGEISALFHVGGGGRKRKLADLEESIIEEVNNTNFHTHQQIADMVHEKFGLKVSPATIRRLLKKTVSGA